MMKTQIRSNWSHAILVCKKCSKKARKRGVTYGRDGDTLPVALRKSLGSKKGRKAPLGLVEVSCLDICPKHGIVLVDTRTPGQWRIVGSDVDMDELACQLRSVDT